MSGGTWRRVTKMTDLRGLSRRCPRGFKGFIVNIQHIPQEAWREKPAGETARLMGTVRSRSPYWLIIKRRLDNIKVSYRNGIGLSSAAWVCAHAIIQGTLQESEREEARV